MNPNASFHTNEVESMYQQPHTSHHRDGGQAERDWAVVWAGPVEDWAGVLARNEIPNMLATDT